MSDELAGKRYAKALFEVGLEKDSLDAFGKNLGEFSEIGLTGALNFLENPIFSLAEKKKAAAAILKKQSVSDEFVNFFNLLIEEKRITALDEIHRHYLKYFNDYKKQEKAVVYSAVKMSDSQIKAIKEKLSKIRGKKMIIENVIDTDVIGGLKVEIGSSHYDGSVRGYLNQFKQRV